MNRARVLSLKQRKGVLVAGLVLVLAAAALYAGNVSVPVRLSQYPSDSLGSPMLVVTVPPASQARDENATRRAQVRRGASTATAWTSARGA